MAPEDTNEPGDATPGDESDVPVPEAAGREDPFLDQSELDSLIAALDDKENRAREDKLAALSASSKSSSGESSDTTSSESSPAVAADPPAREDGVAGTAGETTDSEEDNSLLDQSELDSLIASLDVDKTSSETTPPVVIDAPVPAEGDAVAPETGAVSQSDIDALIQEAVGDQGISDIGDADETPDPVDALDAVGDVSEDEAENTSPEAALTNDEIEGVFNALSSAAEEESAEPDTDAEPIEDLAPAPVESPETPEADAVEDPLSGVLDAAEEADSIEELSGTAQEDAPDPDEVIEALPEIALGDTDDEVSLGGQEMDEVLGEEASVAVAVEEAPEASTEDIPAIASSDLEELGGGAEVASGSELADTSVIEDIGSENVAAGAAPDESPAGSPDATSGPEKAAPAPQAEVAEVAVSRFRLPPSPLGLARREPFRAGASLAAAVLIGISTMLFLYQHRLRTATETMLEPSGAGSFARAMDSARSLMDEREYAAAGKTLDAALRRATDDTAGYYDAKFLRLEATFNLLPSRVDAQTADNLYSSIDKVIDAARAHPRTTEALVWKAQIYEREGNLPAARSEYQSLLDTYLNASNRDAALLGLARVELASDQPAPAASTLQRLLQEYPASHYIPAARLLLGDAYAAAGDTDGARVVYIRLAEEKMDTEAGAEAFERLGKLALDRGRPDAAIRELETRLQSATTVSGNDRVYLVLARAYRAQGQPEKARNVLNELIDFFPESEVTPLALIELAKVLGELNLNAEAVRLATRAVERYPADAEVLRGAGALLAENRDPLAAGKTLLAAYEAGAHEPELLLTAAGYLADAGATREAQEAYQRLIDEFPSSRQAHEATIGWAEAARANGDLDVAYRRLSNLALATQGRPRQLPVLRALGSLYAELGLEQDVIATYGQVASVTVEPEALAEAAIALIHANAVDEGLVVAGRVDPAKLAPGKAYDFLMNLAEVQLRRDVDEALALMEHAHDEYAEDITSEGVRVYLNAALTTGRSALARSLVSRLQTRAAKSRDADELSLLEQAASSYGDFLYRRADFQAAKQAYGIAIGNGLAGDVAVPTSDRIASMSETALWSLYQRANALLALREYDDALETYDAIGAAGGAFAEEAQARAVSTRLERRLASGASDDAGPQANT